MGAGHRGVHADQGHVGLAAPRSLGDHPLHQRGEHPGVAPLGKAVVDRLPGPELHGHLSPLAASAEPPDDALELFVQALRERPVPSDVPAAQPAALPESGGVRVGGRLRRQVQDHLLRRTPAGLTRSTQSPLPRRHRHDLPPVDDRPSVRRSLDLSASIRSSAHVTVFSGPAGLG